MFTKHLCHFVLGSILAFRAAAADSTRLFVATGGNEQWSGRLERPSADRSDGPKASLEGALQAVRALRRDGQATGAISLSLREGRYELSQPVKLLPDDSGFSADQPFTIEAYPGEKPVLSGGRRVLGWHRVPDQPNLWQTEIPEVADGRWYFRQLFVDGVRKQRARTPNDGYFRVIGASPQDKPVRIKFHPGDIKKAWADAEDVELVALLAWADLRMPIREVDEVAGVAKLAGDPRESNQESNARFYIENARDALDQPGEWFLDRKTGVLLYQGSRGEDLTRSEVIASRLDELLLIAGDFSKTKPVRNLVLRGLTFSHTDWTFGKNGYADTQAAIEVHGDVRAEGAVDCRIEDCTFAHLGGYALELGRGCQNNLIIGNEMVDLGGGGIRVGETAKRPEGFESNLGQVITDNHIHRLGRVYPPAVGIFVLQSSKNRLAHNHIHDLYYTAVSVGWNWGYQETPCHDNIVEFNHMHDIGQWMLSDMGAVYTLGIQRGTVVRNNLIHDVNSFTYGGWGLYPDEGTTGTVWENNVVYRTKSAGFHQHYGRENVVRNNIFAFGRERQMMRTREEEHTSFFFTNNIVYFDSGELLGSNWKGTHFVVDSNVYFDARPGASEEMLKFGSESLQAWRARGHDVHSIIADPQFVSPATYDFTLLPTSPALSLGFKPINIAEVGVRPKSKRATVSGTER